MARLLHDSVDDRNSETAEDGGQGAHANVWDMVVGVAVANVLELKVAVKAHEPAREPKEQLGEWRVDIKVIRPENVIGGELSKMNFVESGDAG